MATPLLLCFVLALVGLSRSDPASWPEWKTQYGKRYSTSAEESLRRLIWEKNQRIVNEHNEDFVAGRTSFEMALNAFADRDQTQTRRLLMYAHSRQTDPETPAGDVDDPLPAIPTSWDWRKKGVVDPVRNQGESGFVEAFDAADAVASFAAIHGSPLYVLSAQEVTDCCLTSPLVDPRVFDCIKDHGGLCTDATYQSGTGPNACNNASCKAVASPQNGGKQVTSGDETALAVAVTITPVLVFVDASQPSFQLYTGGVYSDPKCGSTWLDHALLLVGYGVDSSGVEYWICKNSWGTSWGEEGYIRIARNKGNMCGIATAPVYPY